MKTRLFRQAIFDNVLTMMSAAASGQSRSNGHASLVQRVCMSQQRKQRSIFWEYVLPSTTPLCEISACRGQRVHGHPETVLFRREKSARRFGAERNQSLAQRVQAVVQRLSIVERQPSLDPSTTSLAHSTSSSRERRNPERARPTHTGVPHAAIWRRTWHARTPNSILYWVSEKRFSSISSLNVQHFFQGKLGIIFFKLDRKNARQRGEGHCEQCLEVVVDVRCFFMEVVVLAGNMDASFAHTCSRSKSDDLAVILPTIAVTRSKRDALRKVLVSHPENRQELREFLAQFDAPKPSASGSQTVPPIEKHVNSLTMVELKARWELRCTSLDELTQVTTKMPSRICSVQRVIGGHQTRR